MGTEDGKLYMFGAVDRTAKFAYAELHPRATRMIAKNFFDNLAKTVPYKIPTIPTGAVIDKIGPASPQMSAMK
jgi:hypothetical protein